MSTVSGSGKSLNATLAVTSGGTSTAPRSGNAVVSWNGWHVPGRGISSVGTLHPVGPATTSAVNTEVTLPQNWNAAAVEETAPNRSK